MIDNYVALHQANNLHISKTDNLKQLKKQTDNFEAVILKHFLDESLKMDNSLFPKSAGQNIYNSMYKDTLSKELSGGFGYSELLFNYLKEKV